jgi:hypothetical protein
VAQRKCCELKMHSFQVEQYELCRDEIREELGKVVSSAVFRHSHRLSCFLRFVVDAALSGKSSEIKAYTVATGALGRPSSFDPQEDPIVRVEAARLRQALARYYAGVGRDSPLVICLPLGTYVPTFSHSGADSPGMSGLHFRRETTASDHDPEIVRCARALDRLLAAIRDLAEVPRLQVAVLTTQIETAAAEVETLAGAAAKRAVSRSTQ